MRLSHKWDLGTAAAEARKGAGTGEAETLEPACPSGADQMPKLFNATAVPSFECEAQICKYDELTTQM